MVLENSVAVLNDGFDFLQDGLDLLPLGACVQEHHRQLHQSLRATLVVLDLLDFNVQDQRLAPDDIEQPRNAKSLYLVEQDQIRLEHVFDHACLGLNFLVLADRLGVVHFFYFLFDAARQLSELTVKPSCLVLFRMRLRLPSFLSFEKIFQVAEIKLQKLGVYRGVNHVSQLVVEILLFEVPLEVD